MDVTINYILQSGREKEFDLILNNSILKDFEKMVEGNFIPVHYVVINEKDKDDSKDEKEIK
jgi:hypothetical protein